MLVVGVGCSTWLEVDGSFGRHVKFAVIKGGVGGAILVWHAGNCLVACMVCGAIMVWRDAPSRTWLEIGDPNELLGTVVVRARCALSNLARDMAVEVREEEAEGCYLRVDWGLGYGGGVVVVAVLLCGQLLNDGACAGCGGLGNPA